MMNTETQKYTISLGLAPTAQYAKGAMLVARSETATGLTEALADVFEDDELASGVIAAFKKEAKRVASGEVAVEAPEAPAAQRSSSGGGGWRDRVETKSAPSSNGNSPSAGQTKLIFALCYSLVDKGIFEDLDDGATFIGQQLGKDGPAKIKQLSKAETQSAIAALQELESAN